MLKMLQRVLLIAMLVIVGVASVGSTGVAMAEGVTPEVECAVVSESSYSGPVLLAAIRTKRPKTNFQT